MGERGCVDGTLIVAFYGSPVPLVGLYIAIATLVCFFFMTFDLVNGFIGKKPFLPCKLFHLNAFTMAVVSVATKIPNDLTTPMPRAQDQLSKLTGAALFCTSLGFYMPSLGTLDTSERYGNLAALSLMGITMIVNLCTQMNTGVIFAFTIEHIVIMVCILVLLLFMWSSALAFKGQIVRNAPLYRAEMSSAIHNAKDVQGLKNLLEKFYVLSYTGNPQTLLCETSHNHTFGILSVISSAVAFEAMLRSFSIKTCNGVSDYKWSIPMMIVAQYLTILVGTFCIIYRWFSLVWHAYYYEVAESRYHFHPELELENLKSKTLDLRFLCQKPSHVFLDAKDFIVNVLMHTQIFLYKCSDFLGFPIAIVMSFWNKKDIEGSTSLKESRDSALSSMGYKSKFNKWIRKMAVKDMERWRNSYKRDHPNCLIQLISESSASKSECALFIKKIEDTGKEALKSVKERFGFHKEFSYEYRVSCVSVLVLSAMLEQFMPDPPEESLMKSLKESFEILYYVDQKTTANPSVYDETRWMLTENIWFHWENKNYIRNLIQSKLMFFWGKSKSQVSGKDLLRAMEKWSEEVGDFIPRTLQTASFFMKQHTLISIEFSIICDFIHKECKSGENPFDFLRRCFVHMLCFTLSRLPEAMLKEIDEDDPSKIGEERAKKSMKFIHELEWLGNNIKWSGPEKSDPENQETPKCGSEVEAEASNVVDGKAGDSDGSLATAAADVARAANDATIIEIRTNGLFE